MSPAMKPSVSSVVTRRTVLVWTTLVAALTLVTGLLMLLEPMPTARAGRLVVTDLADSGMEALFTTRPAPAPGRWRSIVIQYSGLNHGSAESLAREHQAAGFGGLRHHFVLGNGDGATDGAIQVGYRWTDQFNADHGNLVENAGWFNQHAISICLVGDGDRTPPTSAQMRRLVFLVTQLQQRFGIPSENILLHSALSAQKSPGLLFPTAQFRRELIDPAVQR